ncbi:MAG: GNAT family N-acetyltransferase [Clostridiales bacterium]|nr:GNAT family N-acetyltransferase [Clostridiales bacterium]
MFETERLIIRRFMPSDAIDIYEACNDYEMVKTTLGLPWPYTKEMAEGWVGKVAQREEEGSSYEYAICLKDNPDKIVGCIALMDFNNKARRAEMGYWVARKYWRNGIATEAAKAMLNFGFEKLNLHSIIARYFDINPASGRVMEKAGMRYVGTIRDHEFRFDKFFNVGYYEMLETDEREQ